jgi:hypothetical protein
MIYVYLHYAICVWGNAYNIYINPLLVLQKRAIRLVTNAGWFDHCKSLAYNNSLLMLYDIYLYKCVLTTYRYLFLFNNYSLSHLFCMTSSDRHPCILSVPYCRTTLRKRSFVLSCINVWNKLPTNIRMSRSFVSLEYLCKKHLISNYVD